MTIIRELPLSDHVYRAVWNDRNKRRGETVPQVILRVVTAHFFPEPRPVPAKPLLSYVEVIDDDPA